MTYIIGNVGNELKWLYRFERHGRYLSKIVWTLERRDAVTFGDYDRNVVKLPVGACWIRCQPYVGTVTQSDEPAEAL